MLKFSLGTVLREIKADESDIPKQTFEKDDQQNKNMPELEHGYPFVIVGSLIIVAVIIRIFKKRKLCRESRNKLFSAFLFV